MQKEVPNFKLLYKQNLEHILKLNIICFFLFSISFKPTATTTQKSINYPLPWNTDSQTMTRGM